MATPHPQRNEAQFDRRRPCRLRRNGGPCSAESASGAALRWLDKVSGVTTEIKMAIGQTMEMGRLEVTLSDCRFPSEDPSSDAYAHLTVSDPEDGRTIFAGWMIASSPALSALDDPRYDIWVQRCISN